MKVLQLNQTIFKLLGIIGSKQDPNHFRMFISQYICLISPIPFLISLIGFFLTHFTDVAEATNAFYQICGTGMGFLTLLDCFVNRKTVLSIIQRFQSLADRCHPNYKPFYVKCENQIGETVRRYKILLVTLIYGVFSVPMVVLICHWLNGNFSKDLLVLPCSLLYEISKSTLN